MKMKLIPVLLTLCLLTGLLSGCGLFAFDTPTVTEAPATEAAPVPTVTEAPATEQPETQLPETEATEPTDEPTPSEDLYFVRVADESCDRYTDGCTEILFREQTGEVICRDVDSGAEQTLFTLERDDTIFISLIGVTEDRLYSCR